LKRISLTIIFLALLSNYSFGQIINVPDDQPTIQEAINASVDGDTVLVGEGTYYENINFKGKAITVGSNFIIDADPAHIDNTVINGSQASDPKQGSVVQIISGEDTTSVLYGFTITGGTGSEDPYGYGTLGGGGIEINFSGAKIQFNKIIDNNVTHDMAVGGGIVIASQINPTLILNNYISNNNLISTGINSLGGGGIFCYDSPIEMILIAENVILSNAILDTAGSFTGSGGGIYLAGSDAQIRNSLIKNNKAMNGGGISISENPGSGTPVVINNTIVNNRASGFGGGIYNNGSILSVANSIIWENSASIDQQISGGLIVQYSNVESGYDGEGNISQDPLFADTVNYYLSSNSPCIDSGNPDLIYNDIEDANNLDSALFPAMSGLRNDMGAYGGNPSNTISKKYSTEFQAFLDNVYAVTSGERQTIVNNFMADIDQFPFVENYNHCYFIYSGYLSSVTVAGDMNSWNDSSTPMLNIDGTDFWFRHFLFDSEARLDYKFVTNGSNWVLDPLNPHTCTGGYGPNSELAMPEYIQPTEIEYRPNIPHGSTKDTIFISTALDNSRTIRVYTPPNYDNSMIEEYPVILFHDGLEYPTLCSAINTIDFLISENLIVPIIAVFVPPVNRTAEYATTKTAEFSSFIIDELMQFVDTEYKTSNDPMLRAMTGISYGGLITTQLCYQHPETFGLCAPFSPSYGANNTSVFLEVINGPKKDIKFYVDWGTYEESITVYSKILVNELENKGYEVESNEWQEGHSWGSWRAHLDIALEYFFPGSAVFVEKTKEIPNKHKLSQNYPNPFNPSTTIIYSIPKKSDVTIRILDVLGSEVATLVNKEQPQGNYEVEFDGSGLTSGIYFYRLQVYTPGRAGAPASSAGQVFVETKKMILLK
jgi:enterochelin esterase-like enzyme